MTNKAKPTIAPKGETKTENYEVQEQSHAAQETAENLADTSAIEYKEVVAKKLPGDQKYTEEELLAVDPEWGERECSVIENSIDNPDDSRHPLEICITRYHSGIVTWKVIGPIEDRVEEWGRNTFGETVPAVTKRIDYRTPERVLMSPNGYVDVKRKAFFQSEGARNLWTNVFGNKEQGGEEIGHFARFIDSKKVGSNDFQGALD